MSEQEKKVLEKMEQAWVNMPDRKKGYIEAIVDIYSSDADGKKVDGK